MTAFEYIQYLRKKLDETGETYRLCERFDDEAILIEKLQNKNAEQKAEIERLTEEKERVAWQKQEYLDWVHGLLSTHTEMKDRGEDYKMFDLDWLCDMLWLKSSRSMPLYSTLNAKEPSFKSK